MIQRLTMGLFGLLLIPCSWGYCDIIYNVSFSQTSASLAAGSTINLDVFFDEVVTLGSSHRLTLGPTGEGLINADFAIARSGTGTSAVTAAAGNAGFDNGGGPAVVLGPPTTVVQSIFAGNPQFATDIGGGTYRVQIGTLTITAGGSIGDSNLFSLQDLNANSNFVIDDGFGSLSFVADSTINFGTFTISVVPEPSSLALVGLTCFGAAFLRRRK